MSMPLDIYLSFVVAGHHFDHHSWPHSAYHPVSWPFLWRCPHLENYHRAALADLFYISITAVGVNEILMISLKYFIIIKWLGIAYLTFMGLQKILLSRTVVPITDREEGQQKLRPLFFQGFIITFSNPKTILFYAAFFPPFLNVDATLTL